jgi:hypothetical protein
MRQRGSAGISVCMYKALGQYNGVLAKARTLRCSSRVSLRVNLAVIVVKIARAPANERLIHLLQVGN